MTGEIRIEGEIGTAVTLESIRAQIDPNATNYEIFIDSPGGEVFTGYSIYNELLKLKKPKTVIITGICASIATLIAGVGDRIKMYNVSQYMIHNPSVEMGGDAKDLRKGADTLDQIKHILVTVYEKRTRKAGVSKDRLWEMLDEETWMLPETARQMGFIDEVITSDIPEAVMNKARVLKAVAYLDVKKMNMAKSEKENNSILDSIAKQITALVRMLRPKNMLNLVLSDGTPIVVMTEDETLNGKQVTFEDGSPLSAGKYTTTDGMEFVVDENSTITEATPPKEEEKKPEETPEEDKVMKEQLEKANAEIAELKKQLQAKDTEAKTATETATAQAKILKEFEASLKTVQNEIIKLKGETAGEKENPGTDAHDKQVATERGYDPMAENWGRAFVSRQQVKWN